MRAPALKPTTLNLAASALICLTASAVRAHETPAVSLLPAADSASPSPSAEASSSTPAAPPLVVAQPSPDVPHFTLGAGVCVGFSVNAPDNNHNAVDAIVSVDAGIEGRAFRFAAGGCNNLVLSAELGARGTWLPVRDGFGPMLGGWAGVDWQTQRILDNNLFTAKMALAEGGLAYRSNGHTRTMLFARFGAADVTVNGAHARVEPFVGVAAQFVLF
ncbi:MAG: hypothetical protein JST92_17715 [Deltaproteobacteria bacterium]|nr:hypothetical protein [Deltaproteobacteria bacterium]